MTLKITKASDPINVSRLTVVIYAPPGIGKTSLAFTSAAPLLLDFDNGAQRAANRRDSVRIEKWTDVSDLSADDLAEYKTVVVDTAGRALDALTVDIIRRNPKAGKNGALTLQGYGSLKSEFTSWLKHLNTLGKDVVLIAHMDEQRNGDDIIERLDVQGGSKGEVYKSADAMGRIAIRDGKRMLNFSPTDAAFGKNPGRLEPLEIPHPDKDGEFLAHVIERIKGRLNEMSAAQIDAQKAMADWKAAIETLQTADDFNNKIAAVKQQSKPIQQAFSTAAKDKVLLFNKESGEYVTPEKAAA